MGKCVEAAAMQSEQILLLQSESRFLGELGCASQKGYGLCLAPMINAPSQTNTHSHSPFQKSGGADWFRISNKLPGDAKD